MEDILASIRRVLTKIKGPADIGNKPPEGQLHRNDADNGVPVLDPSMMASGSGNRTANELAAAPARSGGGNRSFAAAARPRLTIDLLHADSR